MTLIRCKSCNKLLAKAIYKALEIKCPRCKAINYLSVQNAPSADHESLCTEDNTRGTTQNKTQEQAQNRPQSPR